MDKESNKTIITDKIIQNDSTNNELISVMLEELNIFFNPINNLKENNELKSKLQDQDNQNIDCINQLKNDIESKLKFQDNIDFNNDFNNNLLTALNLDAEPIFIKNTGLNMLNQINNNTEINIINNSDNINKNIDKQDMLATDNNINDFLKIDKSNPFISNFELNIFNQINNNKEINNNQNKLTKENLDKLYLDLNVDLNINPCDSNEVSPSNGALKQNNESNNDQQIKVNFSKSIFSEENLKNN